MLLEDDVAVVTGGASGTGETTVGRFADEGADVAVAAADVAVAAADVAGEALAADVGGKFSRYDVTDYGDGEAPDLSTPRHRPSAASRYR